MSQIGWIAPPEFRKLLTQLEAKVARQERALEETRDLYVQTQKLAYAAWKASQEA